MANPVNLPNGKIDSVVERGWEILVGTEVDSVDLDSSPFDSGSAQILGICFMRSESERMLLICRGRYTVARAIGASLFGAEEGEIEGEDLQDAFAELTNIFAGNLRGLLSRDYRSDLPMVVSGQELAVSVGETSVIDHWFYRTPSGIIEVSIRSDI